MATYVVQGVYGPLGHIMSMAADGAVAYELTLGAASGTVLTGSGDLIAVHSDTACWLHVSDEDDDVAGSLKTHFIPANVSWPLIGLRKGQYISAAAA